MALILREETRDPLRRLLDRGVPSDRDRLWRIEKDGFLGAVTDYNLEITGFSANMAGVEGLDVSYSGSWYYVHSMLEAKGYRVTHVEDRRP